ncbi:methylmalonyl Co-A mutase-associated GTPase MeaB [Haloechinothrix sp. LS1_15]|uniref:methylmalonyl Co-A mutase-associated GTPase MeaB n=1 Tax=Haloechinothrix sp. LS1_15 TaxID=2652248 RepID=UPI0029465F29|nr:methylmalonyl Co-A mutase-associated GTPase MeaB [Haloechinothrix sp. LS1_15]MDV6013559.1 methylmalonyl Co-A mutase-associated GTPase MeaB [Haloechinothrix sp. LS1_15]
MAVAVDLGELIERVTSGQPRAIARLLSLVEDDHPRLREIARALAPHTGTATVIGLTGPPGAGKSTTTAMLLSELRRAGHRVGVLAIDPSSPFSGGALLGDRIRMSAHATDPGVFIRSMATRGHLGGLAWATPQATRVLETAGFDVVLIETVGVGQSEVDIVKHADTTVVLLAPGMGDGVQAAKAGVLEIADVFVVNKADRQGAEATVRELRDMLAASRREITGPRWRQPIVSTVASRGEGGGDLRAALEDHRRWLDEHGELAHRRQQRARAEVEAIALRQVRTEFGRLAGGEAVRSLGTRVARGELDPYTAADSLMDELKH